MENDIFKNDLARQTYNLKANKEDECIVTEIIKLLKSKEITVDRSQRILENAKTILPLIAKL